MTYDWLHFAERTGEAGRAWAEAYRLHLPEVALSDRALVLMRGGEVEQGGMLLKELADQMAATREDQASIRAVLDRWYYGVAGYHFYCLGDFYQAQEAMQLAHAAVKRAISDADWLAMLAVHCQEFCLHQARIARNQRHWPEMLACVDRAHEMILDRVPLCEKEDGEKIWFSSFRQFFARIEPLSTEESRIASKILDQDERALLFDQFVRRMFRFQEVGIEYP
jgi:hypothetical protein